MPTLARATALAFLGLVCAPFLWAQPTPLTSAAPLSTASLSAVPRLFSLSNTYHPADGQAAAPVESVRLAIYAQEAGGTALWQETQNVALDSEGRYLVLVGLTGSDGLPLELFTSGAPRWLGLHFQRAGESEQPRILLTSVPYALLAARAVDADTLGGRPASAYQLAGVSAGTPAGTTTSRGAAVTLPAAPPAAVAGTGTTAPVQSASVTRKVTGGTTGTIGKFTNATDLGNSVLFETAGKIGLGNTAPLDFMHVQFTDGGGVFTGYGVRNLSAAATAYSGMLFFDQNGALAQFQGFNNATHEYRINNIAANGTINFMLHSQSKFLVRADGDVEMPGSLRKGGALFLHNRGTANFAAGLNALQANTTGGGNVAIGDSALQANTDGNNNVATGGQALLSNTSGIENVATGSSALLSNTTGSNNVATGAVALLFNTTGSNNVATGSKALEFNSSGSRNVSTGDSALQSNTTGNDNVATGASALFFNTTGFSNVATGYLALNSNTTGFGNVASGNSALNSNTTGSSNVATGESALNSNTTGTNNIATGRIALNLNTIGSFNVATGDAALFSNTTGSSNTAIGDSADVSTGALSNATAIGANAKVNASNKIRLGDTNVTVIEGQVAYTFPSDKTRKENFQPANPEEMLRKVAQLPVSSWNYIGHDPQVHRHYGPMAQDFYAAFGDDGVGRIGTATTINSGDMAAVLMLAVQALGQRSEVQIARIAELELDRQVQIARVAALEQDRQAQLSRIATLEQQAAAIAMLQEQMAELQAAGLTAARRDTGRLAAAK